ncbi:MAG: hypothetical protein HKN87_08530 [Saprospiraceae bacterium]|nr:hypothetical protein [Saprospiraceae bacterium]
MMTRRNRYFESPHFPKLLYRLTQLAIFIFLCWTSEAQVLKEELPSRVISLDQQQWEQALSTTPLEFSSKARSAPTTIKLPMPQGESQSFEVVESPIMHPDFAARFPSFKTYALVSKENPGTTGRLSVTSLGIQATILKPDGTIHIRPLPELGAGQHEVAQVQLGAEPMECGTIEDQVQSDFQRSKRMASGTNGANIRTYTLAIVTTGEFFNNNGPTVADAQAVVVNSVNSIQAIFERDLSVRFNLLTPFIYTNPQTDPFPISNRTLEAAQAVEANFSGQGYDLGHVFHSTNSGGSGVAQLSVICSNYSYGTGYRRGGGWSGSSNNSSIGWIGLAAHEFGHMFAMPHSFNGGTGNCAGNISSYGAYEIGSGSTIMSYQGSCSGQNVPGSGAADNYFHTNSIDRALNYLNSKSCEMTTTSGNSPPSIDANPCGGSHTIPVNTPFRLTGSGTDADGDLIYYTWEQYDEDGAGVPTQGLIGSAAAANANAPLFRSFPPEPNPTRYFPNLGLILANDYDSNFEPLPTVARTLNFRLIGRDMQPNGVGIGWSDLAVMVSGAGTFSVTAPNGGQNLSAGSNTTVTWNTGGSNAYCNSVNIKLSVDGGLTYPYTLVSNTANDGSTSVSIPAGVQNTSEARIMVESATSTCVVFFDISNANFTISSDCLAATSSICPANSVSHSVGSSNLNFDLDNLYGGEITSISRTMNTSSPSGQIANGVAYESTDCQTPNWGNRKYVEVDFTVSTAGEYTLTENFSFFAIMSVFEADGFNSSDPCASVFLGSNARGTSTIYARNYTTISLNTCVVYKAMVWNGSSDSGSGSISFQGPGTVYESTNSPGNGYGYSYIAINSATDNVQMVSSSADFRNLALGDYQVYGASYYSGAGPSPTTVNPSSWVGNSLSQILSGGDCALFSINAKNVTVTGPCPPTLVINDNPISSDVYQAGNSITSAGSIATGSSVMFMANQEVQLQPNFEADQNAVFEIVMDGCD